MKNFAISIVGLILFSLTAAAQEIRTERIQLQKGASEATTNAKISDLED